MEINVLSLLAVTLAVSLLLLASPPACAGAKPKSADRTKDGRVSTPKSSGGRKKSGKTPRCFGENDARLLETYWGKGVRDLRQLDLVRIAETLEGARALRGRGAASDDCPFGHLKGGVDLAQRAISPWRYVIRHDPNAYPAKYAEAECLCRGCLDPDLGYRESMTLNSAEVKQTVKFLRRKPCPGSASEFLYEVEYREVATACVCVRPKTQAARASDGR